MKSMGLNFAEPNYYHGSKTERELIDNLPASLISQVNPG